jgi:chromosome segregation ATPase
LSLIANSQNRLLTLPQALDAATRARKDAEGNLGLIQGNLTTIQNQIAALQSDIDNVGPLGNNADGNLANIDAQIADLTNKLNDLKKLRADAQNRSDYFRNLNVSGPSQIRQWQNIINSNINPQLTNAQAHVLDAINNIKKIQDEIDGHNNNITSNNARIRELEALIGAAQRRRDTLTTESNSLASAINTANNNLNSLLALAPTYNQNLINSYTDGNDANDKVARTKALVEALNKKYLDSQTNLQAAQV